MKHYLDVEELVERFKPDLTSTEDIAALSKSSVWRSSQNLPPLWSWYLSIYTKVQMYGGPEEGGWWYDRMKFEGARGFASIEEANDAMESLEDWQEAQNKNRAYQVNKQLAHMPEGSDTYLDTEGYIPLDQVGSDKVVLEVERVPGALSDADKNAAFYE